MDLTAQGSEGGAATAEAIPYRNPIPPELMAAAATPGGERICIIVGAGCSYDTPTRLPLSKELSRQAHEQLVADGVLASDDCADPEDLAALADAVYRVKNRQFELVTRLDPERLRHARPNQGYMLSIAMMLEGVVRTVISLNYDLALSHSAAAVGASNRVSSIKEAADWTRGTGHLLVYLHGNVEGDWEKLVLRTCQLTDEWKLGWEQVVAQAALAAPICVFAGLGSPAPILSTSTDWVRSKLTGEIFLVDPQERGQSPFAAALTIDDDHYVKLGWNDFMSALAARLLVEHRRGLQRAVSATSAANGLSVVDITGSFDQLAAAGMVTLGHAREQWLRQESGYRPLADNSANDLIAELLVAVAAVAQHTGGTVRLGPDGVIEIRDGLRQLGRIALASGRGALGDDALKSRVMRSLEVNATVDPLPSVVIVGATSRPPEAVSPPVDITGPVQLDILTAVAQPARSDILTAVTQPARLDILTAVAQPVFLTLEAVRADPSLVLAAWEAA